MPTAIKIGEFRNHLSNYLSWVRKGKEIIIMDRKNVIGKVIPFPSRHEEASLEMIPPLRKSSQWSRLQFKKISCKKDPVSCLIEDRQKR